VAGKKMACPIVRRKSECLFAKSSLIPEFQNATCDGGPRPKEIYPATFITQEEARGIIELAQLSSVIHEGGLFDISSAPSQVACLIKITCVGTERDHPSLARVG
jgi:hypothetical protein